MVGNPLVDIFKIHHKDLLYGGHDFTMEDR